MDKNSSKFISINEVEDILDGISDIIKVFNSDHTVYFCNKAGYEFYEKEPKEVNGMICYKLLNRNKPCSQCCFYEVIEKKKMIKQERYIEELNKIMDVCYNPIFDEEGNVRFIIERSRDITEKKAEDVIIKNDKDRYKEILNAFPDALMIIIDNKIELANKKALDLFEVENSEIINSNIYRYFDEKYSKIMHKKLRQIILGQKSKNVYDCELKLGDKKINVQLSGSYILYDGNPAVLVIARNISETRRNLMRAATFQKNSLQKHFPCSKLLKVATVYVPAYTISGDFYLVKKIRDQLVIGILIDVKGKGMQAALNISAFELMFMEEIAKEIEPLKIVERLNRRLVNYYEENYIAVSCFSLDFMKKEMKIVGAGINEFILQKHNQESEIKLVEGPFLGMFKNSEFSQVTFQIESGDRIFLLSDGLDFVFEDYNIIKRYLEKSSVSEFKNYINEYIEDTILDCGGLQDDCTILAIEIK